MKCSSTHRLGKAPDRLFPAPSWRAVGNNRDLLDAVFLDALDWWSAFGGRSDCQIYFDRLIGDRSSLVRPATPWRAAQFIAGYDSRMRALWRAGRKDLALALDFPAIASTAAN